MTAPSGPFFPSVDPQTLTLRDQHMPSRLSPANLTESTQDIVGSMTVATAPVTAAYNDTLGTVTIGYDQAQSTYGDQCRLYRNGTQTITAGAVAAIILNTQTFLDSTALYSTNLTTGTITVLQAGSYLATWAIRFSAATSGQRYASISVGGVNNTRSEVGATTGSLTTQNGAAAIRLLANEFVNLCAFVDGANVDVQGANNFATWLSLVRLGA